MHALEAHGLERVAIIDFDVHHGNGTEDIFEDDERVLMASTFQHPFYPYSGTDHPARNMVNVPLQAGTGSQGFREAVERRWLPALDDFAPQMIFFSAGFDAHVEDDMAMLRFVDQDYAWVTQQVKTRRRPARGRTDRVGARGRLRALGARPERRAAPEGARRVLGRLEAAHGPSERRSRARRARRSSRPASAGDRGRGEIARPQHRRVREPRVVLVRRAAVRRVVVRSPAGRRRALPTRRGRRPPASGRSPRARAARSGSRAAP